MNTPTENRHAETPANAARSALIVEDEPSLAELLADTLVDQGFVVSVLSCGAEVVTSVRALPPTVLLLDVGLPDANGFDLCRSIRAFSQVPLIMITGKAAEADRLRGLDLGADDYICKPFHAAEVAARVRALLRRTIDWREATAGSPLSLDESRYEARWHGVRLDLTPVEFRLLCGLGQRPGRVYTRAALLDMIYLNDHVVSDRTIDSHIKNLRRKLTESVPDKECPIESIYGVGYTFKG
ncbi:MAG: response regulator [Pseudomarimonas sp.]